MTKILGIRKQKKALLKNAGNLKEIYEMYMEKIDYKIIYPNRVVVQHKFKYKVEEVLNKFNINSVNELIFLFTRYFKPIKFCEFCKEEVHKFQLRTSFYNNDCRCEGICVSCNQPTSGLYKNNYCYWCRPKEERSDLELLGKLLTLIQYGEEEIRQYSLNQYELKWNILYLSEKLDIFKKLYEENSHGSEISNNNIVRITSGKN